MILRGHDPGGSYAMLPEVAAALSGHIATMLRQNGAYSPQYAFEWLSRVSSLRIHHARPIIVNGRVVGVLLLSRSPRALFPGAVRGSWQDHPRYCPYLWRVDRAVGPALAALPVRSRPSAKQPAASQLGTRPFRTRPLRLQSISANCSRIFGRSRARSICDHVICATSQLRLVTSSRLPGGDTRCCRTARRSWRDDGTQRASALSRQYCSRRKPIVAAGYAPA
jgi:hypothetical protein